METSLQEKLEKLLNAYSHHYDVQRNVTVDGGQFPAAAEFYLRDENRLLTKDHIFYALEQHEYVYFFLTRHLTAAALREQISLSLRAGLARIHPHKDHMCSFVTLVILADTIDPEAKVLLRKTHFRKMYRLMLHGWMEYRLAGMEVSTASFFSNPAGREARKTLENNFGNKVKTKKGENIHEWFSSFGH